MKSDVELLAERKEANSKIPRVHNAELPAGSPMHYYCQLCGVETDVLPEEHPSPPTKFCYPCQKMMDAGWSESEQKFIKYENVVCFGCGGSGLGVYDYYLKRRRKCYQCNGTRRVKKRMDVV